MFHLFNKTYIDIDTVIDNNVSRIVISKKCGYPFLEMLKSLYPQQYHAFGLTYEDVVGPEKEFATFYDMLEKCNVINNQGNKIVIYCDQESYLKIISLFYKTIFVNIDAVSAYRISKAHFSKELMLLHRSSEGIEFVYENWLPSFEDFSLVFHDSSIDEDKALTFLSTVENYRSIDYLLASYLFNGSNKTELKFRTYQMLLRFVEEFFKEVWRGIQCNIGRKDFQEMYNTKEYTIDNLTDVLTDPVFADLRNLNEWRSAAGGINPKRTPLNLVEYTNEQMDIIIRQSKLLFLRSETATHPAMARKYTYIDIVRDSELSDQDLEDVLDVELNPTDDLRFWGMKDNETVNIYFADWILDKRKYGGTEELGPYLLK